jgi:pyruvate dehydrogenase E2 component (dihydrolipoamide acetyltransferase)
MPIDIQMPALSPTMEKGTLAKWLVGIGDRIKAGDLIAEIETDKATMEFEAIDDGVVAELVIAEGSEDVPVGTVIARIAGEGEAVAAPAAAAPPTPEPAPAAPPAPVAATPVAVAAAPAAKPAQTGLAIDAASNVRASPLARRLAAAKGIDLSAIAGSGAGGKIVRQDVIGPDIVAAPVPAAAAAAASTPAAEILPPPDGVPHRTTKLSGMRKTIARRLTQSKQTVPHFYLSVHCNLDPLLKLRAALNADLAAAGIKLSVNDLLVKALASALTEVPAANVQYGGDTLYEFDRVDVSMAVAIPGGLVTPVIRDVGGKSVSRIAAEAKAIAAKARDGKLAPEDYQGGTVSISNLGMFGISEMLPVINPPQAMILGVASGEQRPWVVDGAVVPATVMTATASFDHRAIDGATGAEVLARFRQLVETPMTIIA